MREGMFKEENILDRRTSYILALTASDFFCDIYLNCRSAPAFSASETIQIRQLPIYFIDTTICQDVKPGEREDLRGGKLLKYAIHHPLTNLKIMLFHLWFTTKIVIITYFETINCKRQIQYNKTTHRFYLKKKILTLRYWNFLLNPRGFMQDIDFRILMNWV